MSAPRLMTAMITPYGDNLKVNLSQAAKLAEYLYENGSEGIVVCGTTGESPVLSADEKLPLFAAVKEKWGRGFQYGQVPGPIILITQSN